MVLEIPKPIENPWKPIENPWNPLKKPIENLWNPLENPSNPIKPPFSYGFPMAMFAADPDLAHPEAPLPVPTPLRRRAGGAVRAMYFW